MVRPSKRFHFEVVPLPERLRHAALNAAQGRKILSVAYDPALRETRRLLLEGAGYHVTSTGTRAEAIALCRRGSFDLVVIGNGVPRAEKLLILRELRQACDTPALVLRAPAESKLPQVDYDIHPAEGPAAFLLAVKEIFLGRRTRSRPD